MQTLWLPLHLDQSESAFLQDFWVIHFHIRYEQHWSKHCLLGFDWYFASYPRCWDRKRDPKWRTEAIKAKRGLFGGLAQTPHLKVRGIVICPRSYLPEPAAEFNLLPWVWHFHVSKDILCYWIFPFSLSSQRKVNHMFSGSPLVFGLSGSWVRVLIYGRKQP